MHDYQAYGLTVRSPFRLPELRELDQTVTEPDVAICSETLEPAQAETSPAKSERWIDAEPGRCRFTYEEVGTFLIIGGERVLVDPVSPDITSTLVFRRLLEGQALGVLCHQRGDLVLHGSAVDFGGNAVVFLGNSGAGKSTTAAACYDAGYPLLDDDVVVIRFSDGAPKVVAGVPQLKLEPETAVALGIEAVTGTEVDSFSGKAFHRTQSAGGCGAVPLSRCYILSDGDTVAVEPVPARQRLVELVLSTYTAGLLSDTDAATRNFEACSSVVKHVSVTRLIRPRRLDILPTLVRCVVSDLDTDSE
ncbi:Hpr(Ser) kinase/phosphatase [Halorientalis persicus]|uniref:Hpr(Ser) kinase/phosphatase n=1 Tax=Halorientalis persicus TaxID=1367881 RepID=A0A1H8SXZ2_9EURY|nr:hypothetical protein [Halorientalis persicus]SEO83336.1 Hpr(Ser) kinase/phosphatase [Halorientalis persicus]